MLIVESFVSTVVSNGFDPIASDIRYVTSQATGELQEWLCKEGNMRVISTSTQLVATNEFVSYAITAVADQDRKEDA